MTTPVRMIHGCGYPGRWLGVALDGFPQHTANSISLGFRVTA